MWEIPLGVVVVVLAVLVLVFVRSNSRLRFQLRSSSVKHGMTMEQMLPFAKGYPYDPRGFRFIGDPVDGVQFNDDSVVFVEFKSGGAKLSEKQRRIKENIEKKKIDFRELRSD
jgi:predicted Holliday junction resolvase-like endonuclease